MKEIPEAKNYFVKIEGANGLPMKITKDQAQSFCDTCYYAGVQPEFQVSSQKACFISFVSCEITPSKIK